MHECRLHVEPRQFAKALKFLARFESKAEWANIDFDGQKLMMRLGETEQRIPAAGSWPGVRHFRSRFARALAARPLLNDPLELSVEDDRLTVGTFSFPCSLEPVVHSDDESHEDQIAEAAHILKKLHVSRDTIAALVANADPQYARLWSDGYDGMMDRIAKAWKILGPLGVDPREIRRAIEESVRHAFQTTASRKE
jgi:hypothetical protein